MRLIYSGVGFESENNGRDFHNRSPAAEAPNPSSFSVLKRWLARVLLGAQLATAPFVVGGTATLASCSSVQEEKTTIKGTQTDANGNATFEINGREFKINVYDSQTQNPLSGLSIILTAKDDYATYVIIDNNNTYPTWFGSVEGHQANQTQDSSVNSSDSNPDMSNIFLTPSTPLLCGIGISGVAPQDIVNSALGLLFDKIEVGVKLSDLDNSAQMLIDAAKGQVGGTVVETGAVGLLAKFGASSASKVLSGVGDALSILEGCSDLESLSWANYYRSLCYQDADTFTIYRIKGLGEIEKTVNDIGHGWVGVNIPLFLVVPSDGNTHNPSYATINGQVYLPDGSGWQETGEKSFTVDTIGVGAGYLPPSIYFGPPFSLAYYTRPITIYVNACPNLQLSYQVYASTPVDPIANPQVPLNSELATSAPFKITVNDDYLLDFYLQITADYSQLCPNGYQTYCGSNNTPNSNGGLHHDMAVACSAPDGYQLCQGNPGIDGGIDASSTDAGVVDANAVDAVAALYCPGVTDFSCGFGNNDPQSVWNAGHLTFSTDFSQDNNQSGNITVVCNSTGTKLIDGATLLSNGPIYSWILNTDNSSGTSLIIIYTAAYGGVSFTVGWPDNITTGICE